MGVKCLAQEHNTMSPARDQTRTARSGVRCTNHEATAPPTNFHINRGDFLLKIRCGPWTRSMGCSMDPGPRFVYVPFFEPLINRKLLKTCFPLLRLFHGKTEPIVGFLRDSRSQDFIIYISLCQAKVMNTAWFRNKLV